MGPIRAHPRRAYIYYSPSSYELEDDGGNAAQILWLKRDELVTWDKREVKLEDAVNSCLELLNLKQKVYPSQSSSIIYQIKLDTLSKTKKRVTIADVGFGYSQVLPIILRGLLAPENSLILFEQPEIHLHPSCRANLADFFLELIKNDKKVLIETHSTEIIDRIRLRCIQNPELIKNINISFIEPPKPNSNEGSTIRQLKLDEEGMFDEYPEGFCDTSLSLAESLISARVKKNK